jgi:hypothetical protein
MRLLIIVAVLMTVATSVQADGMDEVNEWRRRTGLPLFIEDPEMTKFAQMKARHRAENNLRNGHQGPKPPARWHEGTGEASSLWGWLTCEMECDFTYAGAGLCVGKDGTRYMVLVCRGGSSRPFISRRSVPVHSTSHLTPKPARIRVGIFNAKVLPRLRSFRN